MSDSMSPQTPEAALSQALALLDEMKLQAQTGAMVPFRVPGQIDAIRDLLEAVRQAQASPTSAESSTDTASPDAPAAAPDVNVALADLSRELSEFLSTAVHELRIPLTSIRGYSDMIAKKILGDLNEQQAQFMETIRSNVLRMDHLISDVNDVGKLRANRLHVEPRMDTAKNILLMAQKDAQPLADERQIALVFEVPDGLPLLNVDGKRVAQALDNLIQNALNYAPEGSTVTVSASAEDGRLRVTVKDEGVGMTPEDAAHLGEPFWRSDHETIRSVKGHGLGYAVAKGIIELMGGTMIVETALGQGSTFGFTLPGMG